METVSEGELVNGVARVPLRSYASKIDTTKNHLVFITPQGQTQGNVYVAGKSPAGYTTRQLVLPQIVVLTGSRSDARVTKERVECRTRKLA